MGPDGVWAWGANRVPNVRARTALFLDRDGVLLEHVPYLGSTDHVRLLPGAAEAVAAANQAGLPVVVVTNQSGVGRGYFGWHELSNVLSRMQGLLAAQGAAVDAVYACPYHRDALPPYDRHEHPARKPNPGMLQRAACDLNLHLGSSWIVGDTAEDLLAGMAAGIAGGIHVLTGLGAGERDRVHRLRFPNFRVVATDSLPDAVAHVLSNLAGRPSRARRGEKPPRIGPRTRAA